MIRLVGVYRLGKIREELDQERKPQGVVDERSRHAKY